MRYGALGGLLFALQIAPLVEVTRLWRYACRTASVNPTVDVGRCPADKSATDCGWLWDVAALRESQNSRLIRLQEVRHGSQVE
jgi:hypothetical protein